MKLFKKINISSDGSFYFSYKTEVSSVKPKSVFFQKQDDKNFSLYKKKSMNFIDSKYSLTYKKKYLN